MKRVAKYTDHLFASLARSVKAYARSHDAEQLHHIRTDVKRMKAVINLLDYSCKGFRRHRNFIPFRNIFRKAGKIREPDVLNELLLRYQVAGIDNNVISDNKKYIDDFDSDTSLFIGVIRKKRKKFGPLSKKIRRDDLERYLQKKKRTVKAALYPRPDMRPIHKVRKSIKEILYLSEIYDNLKRREKKFYNEMEDVIGKLHDKQVLLGLLKGHSSESSLAKADVIRSECRSDKEKIRSLVNDYFSKA